MSAIERRQALLEVLCQRRYDRIDNLAFEFGVHRNTIKNDLLELSLSYPIYTRKGGRNSGGVYIEEGYYIGKQFLSPEQKRVLEELSTSCSPEQQKILASILIKFGRKN